MSRKRFPASLHSQHGRAPYNLSRVVSAFVVLLSAAVAVVWWLALVLVLSGAKGRLW